MIWGKKCLQKKITDLTQSETRSLFLFRDKKKTSQTILKFHERKCISRNVLFSRKFCRLSKESQFCGLEKLA